MAIVLSAMRWGHLWTNKRVVVSTDNMTTKCTINKGSSRNKTLMTQLRELFWLSATHNFDIRAKFISGRNNVIADAASRLYEPGQLSRLYDKLMEKQWKRKCWENSMVRLKSKGWASSTSGTYRTHLKTYLEFCENYDQKPVPCTTKTTVELYIAFLVDVKNFAFSSIRSYLNIISVLHKSHDKPDPIASCWNVRHLLTGVKRELGTSQNCKAPVTPELLLRFKSILNLECHNNIVFWAACLTGFYGFLRPNNFLVKGSFDPEINLRRVDVLPCSWGMLVTFKVTKTLQFRSKPIEVILPLLHGHQLCPYEALSRVLALPRDPLDPLFSLVVHVPEVYRIVNTKSILCEQEERSFGSLRRIAETTTNRKPGWIIDNTIIRYNAQQNSDDRCDSFAKQDSSISRQSKRLPHRINTIFTKKLLSRKSSVVQAHLARIADFILPGDQIWWHYDGENVFHDSIDEPNFRLEGPPLSNYRSTSLKKEITNVNSIWESCISLVKYRNSLYQYLDLKLRRMESLFFSTHRSDQQQSNPLQTLAKKKQYQQRNIMISKLYKCNDQNALKLNKNVIATSLIYKPYIKSDILDDLSTTEEPIMQDNEQEVEEPALILYDKESCSNQEEQTPILSDILPEQNKCPPIQESGKNMVTLTAEVHYAFAADPFWTKSSEQGIQIISSCGDHGRSVHPGSIIQVSEAEPVIEYTRAGVQDAKLSNKEQKGSIDKEIMRLYFISVKEEAENRKGKLACNISEPVKDVKESSKTIGNQKDQTEVKPVHATKLTAKRKLFETSQETTGKDLILLKII
ncbi:unnamed protein product [Mytilus coruscus]|uniref:Integrase SAM-like N-terminal domain-containing protein n=1 Tax=Mytilus coruscus TaxID=42192 RepID=A0A6J8C7A8_MYTCO|nr:unnamed protein product [Mytilus coruscus]